MTMSSSVLRRDNDDDDDDELMVFFLPIFSHGYLSQWNLKRDRRDSTHRRVIAEHKCVRGHIHR